MLGVGVLFEQGGLNVYSLEAREYAERMYEEIRKRKTDCENIARNTHFSREQIDAIKHYVFFSEHFLNGKWQRFHPSYEMAESWRRLSEKGGKNIKPHDITLLHHELTEILYLLMHFSNNQSYAHDKACVLYDYPHESDEYYKNTGQRK